MGCCKAKPEPAPELEEKKSAEPARVAFGSREKLACAPIRRAGCCELAAAARPDAKPRASAVSENNDFQSVASFDPPEERRGRRER